MSIIDKIKEKLERSQAPPIPSSDHERAKEMQNPEGAKDTDNDPPEETTVVR